MADLDQDWKLDLVLANALAQVLGCVFRSEGLDAQASGETRIEGAVATQGEALVERALLVRYDKKVENYLALLKLVCALLWYCWCVRLAL